LGVNRRRPE